MISSAKKFRRAIALFLFAMTVAFVCVLAQQLLPAPSTTTTTAPKILSVTISTNGHVELRIAGPAEHSFVVQSSTNLSDWSGLATNVFSAGSGEFFVDTKVRLGGASFYRVVQMGSAAGAPSTTTTRNRGLGK